MKNCSLKQRNTSLYVFIHPQVWAFLSWGLQTLEFINPSLSVALDQLLSCQVFVLD